MCGISGFIDSSKTLDTITLVKMSEVLNHRGPDSNNYVVLKNHFANIGLAHNRLSILDLTEAGNQPMEFNGSYICFNGEIYNYVSIRAELIKNGYLFKTNTDTEVILKAFDKWGISCVNKFIGMFAFVIYRDDKVYFCRDRAGVKPLYYYFNGEQFIFASELKSILKNHFFNKEIDLNAVVSFFKFGYIEDSHCIYKNTYKLTPGSWLILDLQSFNFEQIKYWDVTTFYEDNRTKLSYSEIKEKTKGLLLDSFKLRMISDVPVGIFLSGGYDSNCLAGILASCDSYNLNTFSVGFENYTGNETHVSRKTSKIIGSNHTEIICSKNDIAKTYNKISSFYDEPFSDISSIPSMIVCEIAKLNGVTVALSADGGDEIFGGYNKYLSAIEIAKKSSALNNLSKGFIKITNTINGFVLNHINYGSVREKLELYNKKANLLDSASPERILQSISLVFNDSELNSLLIKTFSETNSQNEYDSENNISDFLDKLLCVDFKTYMRDDILTKMDRAGMSSSLEVREPFLDHRIIEWVATIPSNLKINNDLVTKFLLKDITHDFIPESILNKKKQGFGFPVLDFLKEIIESQILIYLNQEFIKKQGIFNYEYINYLTYRFSLSPDKYFKKIWLLVTFQCWYDKWILKS